jgi:hypothetical protein
MDFVQSIKQAFKVVELNDHAIRKVAKDQSATWPAIIIVIVASFCGAFGSILFPIKYGPVIYRPTFLEAVGHAIVAVFLFLIIVYLLHLVANHLFQARGDYLSLLRVIGHGYIIGVLSLLPVLSILVLIWGLVLLVRILKDVKRLKAEQAIIAVVLVGMVIFVFLAIFQDLNADNLYGALYLVPH